jgi:putative transposase
MSDFSPFVIPSDMQDSMEVTMPWTEITRAQYRREGLRYASDVTDQEWAVIAALLPLPSRLGRPRRWDLRTILV